MKRLLMVLAVVGLILGTSIAADAAIATPYAVPPATTQWTTTTSAVGSSSLQLNDPLAGVEYVGAEVTDLGDPTIANFDGWDYWTRGPQFHGVNLFMYLDTPYPNYEIGGVDHGWDVQFRVMPYNTLFYEGGNSAQPIPGDTWVNLDSSTRYPYGMTAWGPSGAIRGFDIATQSNAITWTEFQNLGLIAIPMWTETRNYDFAQATVEMVRLRMGGGGHMADQTGYLDDFTLNGIPFAVEGGSITVIPEPTTILVWSLLGLAVAGYGVWRRKRAA